MAYIFIFLWILIFISEREGRLYHVGTPKLYLLQLNTVHLAVWAKWNWKQIIL